MSTDDLTVPIGYATRLFDVSGRVAVVTGAGSGLGAAMAIGFGQVGVSVIAADVNLSGAETTAETIRAEGGSAEAMKLDVTRREQCFDLANSAGSAFRCAAEEFPEEKFDAIIALNLKGSYLCCQAFGQIMLAQSKGSIINIASIGSFIAYPWASAYLASKGGVLQITRALALEWRSRGVRVNGIAPTLMDSPLARAAAKSTSITSDFIKARMLRPRPGLPRELIGTAIFLASDASELVTGHVVVCDDGYLVA
jgi:NAD(P)-dependent dehydrogenase (short-subunit alcohol dehydrogenase family)